MILAFDNGSEVDTIDFDATMSERWDAKNSVTRRPVEQGADVADHVVVGAVDFSCVVVVSDTPITVPTTQMYGVTGQVREREVDIGSVRKMRKGADAAKGTAAEYDVNSGTVRIATLEFSEAFSRVERIGALLEQIRKSAFSCTVLTTTREEDNMQLATISAPRTRGSSVEFSLTFTQIRTADSETVSVPEPAEPRARASTEAGRQKLAAVTDAPTQASALSALAGLF